MLKSEYMNIKKYYEGRKVLITGHTGFVGSWLCMTLEFLGAKIIGFSLKEEKNSLYAKIKNELSIENHYGNIEYIEEIKKCINDSNPDIIIHLAAYGFIQECMKEPYRTYMTNVIGTVNLFEAIRDNSCVKTVVVASSDKVYQNDGIKKQLFIENDSLGGSDPYSCSKTCEDMITQSYYNTYLKEKNINMIILRPSNIIGGGDHNNTRLIPSLINSVKNGTEINLRNPEAIRPWQYILDAVNAYIVCGMQGERFLGIRIYNVGPTPNNIRSVSEVEQILKEISEDVHSKQCNSNSFDKNIEKKYLGLNISKILNETDWRPNKNINETLKDTFYFYIKDEAKNSYELCHEYIDNYYSNY